jgi:hypothetical protein
MKQKILRKDLVVMLHNGSTFLSYDFDEVKDS